MRPASSIRNSRSTVMTCDTFATESFFQARRLGRNQDISRSIDETKVSAQHDGNRRVQTTPVEGVALHDQHRPVVSGLGALQLTEIRRPDLAPFDYHGSRVSDRPCRRFRARGNRLSSDP